MMKNTVKIIVGIMAVGIGINAYGAETPGRIYAGTAKADITPSEKDAADLVDHKLKIHDDRLYARVVVLKTDETSLAIVSLDQILFSSRKVVTEAKRKWKVDHVILSSTHTHAAMAAKGLRLKPHSRSDWTRRGDPAESVNWPALSEDPWYAATEDKIVAAIGEAMKNTFPATIASGSAPYQSAYMAHNRRLVRKNGTVDALWANPKRIPTKPTDPTVGFIRIDDDSGKPRAFMVHYACHPVASANSGYLSRDFPGAMVDYVEKELGDECLAMFLQGASGDLDPYDMAGGKHGFNVMRQCGIALGKAALQAAKKTKPQKGTKNSSIRVQESLLKIRHRRGNKTSDALLTTVVINNDIALVSIPGEPFIQHQLNLREKSPVATTFMLGLAYSGTGCPYLVYIPTVQAVKEGGYGATECSFVAADAGKKMVAAALNSINKLSKIEKSAPGVLATQN